MSILRIIFSLILLTVAAFSLWGFFVVAGGAINTFKLLGLTILFNMGAVWGILLLTGIHI